MSTVDSYTSKDVVKLIAEGADDKKAEDISVLDMRDVVNFCDYFVICSGNNERHIQAIADNISDALNKDVGKYNFKNAMKSHEWIVLDIGDIVVHVFLKDKREFYGLEHLWQEAKSVDWKK